MPAALIDRHMPCYDVRARYAVTVDASAGKAYDAVRSLNLASSPIIRALFRLRGLPTGRFDRSRLKQLGFVELGEHIGSEYVMGLIGRFWTPGGDVQRMADAEAFDRFADRRFAKAVWNFTVRAAHDGRSEVATETRVACLSPPARRRFRIYWTLLGPFSGWIRREALKIVKRSAED